jgi:hypothetical protein
VRFTAFTEPIPLSDVGGAWVFPEQGVLYTESTATIPTVEHARTLFDFFDWMIHHQPAEKPTTVIHDWRSMRSIPSDVRQTFIARRKRFAAVMRPARVVIAVKLNPVIRMGIQTVSLAAQMFTDAVPIDVVAECGPTLREYGVSEPDPSLHARLRLAWRHARGMTIPPPA